MHLVWNGYYHNKVPHASAVVGSLWWKDIIRLSVLCRGVAKCSIGDGSSGTFWEDFWTETLLSTKYPRLYYFVLNPIASVREIVMAPDLASIFQLPLSLDAHVELLDLQAFVQEVDFDPDEKDIWTFMWGNQTYSSRRYYKMVFHNLHSSLIFAKLWKSKCTQG